MEIIKKLATAKGMYEFDKIEISEGVFKVIKNNVVIFNDTFKKLCDLNYDSKIDLIPLNNKIIYYFRLIYI